jgi:hypothetical protein
VRGEPQQLVYPVKRQAYERRLLEKQRRKPIHNGKDWAMNRTGSHLNNSDANNSFPIERAERVAAAKTTGLFLNSPAMQGVYYTKIEGAGSGVVRRNVAEAPHRIDERHDARAV